MTDIINNKIDENLIETFWDLYGDVKRKSNPKKKISAQLDLMDFCQRNFGELSESTIDEAFGKYSDFVKKWLTAELVTNKFGRYLYVKLGATQ